MCHMLQPDVPQVAVQLLAAPELLGETSLLLRWQLLGADGHSSNLVQPYSQPEPYGQLQPPATPTLSLTLTLTRTLTRSRAISLSLTPTPTPTPTPAPTPAPAPAPTPTLT